MPLREAIFHAHFPDNAEMWQAARSRLAFDELLTLQLAMQSRRRDTQAEVHGVAVRPSSDVAGSFLSSLAFELTGAQSRCIGEIAADISRGSAAYEPAAAGRTSEAARRWWPWPPFCPPSPPDTRER